MVREQRTKEAETRESSIRTVSRELRQERNSAETLPSASVTHATSTTKSRDGGDITLWLQDYVVLRNTCADSSKQTPAALTTLGDLKARIASHFTSLVESIARRFVHTGEPFEDLVQEGFLGLLSALENYDPSKKVKFSTYATHFVAGAIRHFLRDRGKIIKEPAWLHELYTKISRASDSLTQRLGRPATSAEIAKVAEPD